MSESPDQNCDWFKLLLNQYLKPGDEVGHDFDFSLNLKLVQAMNSNSCIQGMIIISEEKLV